MSGAPGLDVFGIRGTIGDVEHRIDVRPDGTGLSLSRKLAGSFEISIGSP